ncbi:Nuclear poly(A) polymerase 3 [Zea mays]|uniref:polynucleotide adenylyltransferase n=1 Tax=Zea mays TaxID=4577 RepID=A0A1D6INV9_MAIZE|nr:Nuclear poly(A) polymerase 3 [Zea mays]
MAYMTAVAPVPWWPPPPELAHAGLLVASSPAGYPEPQTLPFLFAPLPPPPPAGCPLLPPPAPIVIQLQPHPSLLAEVDHRRSSSLVQFLKDEGAVLSPEDENKREKVIRELKKIVMHWANAVAYEQSVPQGLATATVLTYGSYTLGAHGPESDIDLLCLGPCIATLQYHFFVVLRQILQGRPEVSEVHTVEKAKFCFTGNTMQKFQTLLRCIKLWARKRGLHCHYLGFFAGIHLAILAAYVCRKFPDASVSGLFAVFFQTFAHWPWQVPVSLHDELTTCLHSEGRLMPIVMPCTPPEFCASTVTKGSLKKIREELTRGYVLTRDPLRHDFQWSWLFEPFPYDQKYQQFLRIALRAPTIAELGDWAGWVKSRFRFLILKLERAGIECDPCPSEEVDHTDNDPNVVFYWGLIPKRIIQVDTSSLKGDFMEDLTNDVYGTVKCTHSDVTISVVGLPQLPKSMCSRVYPPAVHAALYDGLRGHR